MKRNLFLTTLIITGILPLFSKNLLNVDFKSFEKIDELSFVYSQVIEGEEILSEIKISKSRYAEEDVIVYENRSSKYESFVYVKLNGDLIKTKIFDKKNKARYTINYGKSINISIITEDKKYEKNIPNDCIDTSALALLLSAYKAKNGDSLNVKLLDYKNLEINEVKINVLDIDSKIRIGKNEVDAIKYEISSFLFYDSTMFYAKGKLPVLLYYEGPTSINFLDRTKLSITPDSYLKNIKIITD